VHHSASFDDGSYFHLTVIRRKHLELLVTGYIVRSDLKQPVTQATSLRGFGDAMPGRYQFIFVPSDRRPLLVEVQVDTEKVFAVEFGKEDAIGQGSAVANLGIASFKLGRLMGKGVCQWGYSRDEYRPPIWTTQQKPVLYDFSGIPKATSNDDRKHR